MGFKIQAYIVSFDHLCLNSKFSLLSRLRQFLAGVFSPTEVIFFLKFDVVYDCNYGDVSSYIVMGTGDQERIKDFVICREGFVK